MRVLHFYTNELRQLEHVFNIISVNVRSPSIAMANTNNKKGHSGLILYSAETTHTVF